MEWSLGSRRLPKALVQCEVFTSAEELFRETFSEYERQIARLLPSTASATLGRGKASMDRQFKIMASWTQQARSVAVGNLDMASWSKRSARARFLAYLSLLLPNASAAQRCARLAGAHEQSDMDMERACAGRAQRGLSRAAPS